MVDFDGLQLIRLPIEPTASQMLASASRVWAVYTTAAEGLLNISLIARIRQECVV